MTIQIIRQASLGLPPGAIRTLDASTEAALIADKEAISVPAPNPPGDEEAVRYDPTTGNLIGARGQILSSVSTPWIRYKLGGRCGLLATPVATLVVAGGVGQYALPEPVVLPANSAVAGSRLYYDVRARRTSAAGTMPLSIRLGPLGTVADPVIGYIPVAATLNLDSRAVGSFDFASAASGSSHLWGTVNGSSASAALDVTSGIDATVDMYLTIHVIGTNGDTSSLIAYSFFLER